MVKWFSAPSRLAATLFYIYDNKYAEISLRLFLKSREVDLPGSVMCHECMKAGCHLGQCTAILKEERREEDHQRNG